MVTAVNVKIGNIFLVQKWQFDKTWGILPAWHSLSGLAGAAQSS
jgi:hypothetical protein